MNLQIVGPDDKLILGEERTRYNEVNECFEPPYDLSLRHLRLLHNRSTLDSFDDRVLANWAIFSMLGHPLIKELLENVVKTIKHEYMREPIFAKFANVKKEKWRRCVCMTGPHMLTSSLKKSFLLHLLNNGSHDNFPVRTVRDDFGVYGGRAKAHGHGVWGRGHYMELIRNNATCLREYTSVRAHYEGMAVWKDWRTIYLVENGTLRVFPNYDTFIGMGFTMNKVVLMEDEFFDTFPVGAQLPPGGNGP